MTTYSDIVRIRAPTKDYVKNWKSKTRKVDAIWYGRDSNDEIITQLVSSTQHPNLYNSGTLEDIELELEQMPVCQDGVKPQKTTPKKLKQIETFIDHPGFDKDRDFIRSRFRNIKELWINHQELIETNQKLRRMGYTRGLQDFKQKRVNPKNPNQIFYCLEFGECEY